MRVLPKLAGNGCLKVYPVRDCQNPSRTPEPWAQCSVVAPPHTNQEAGAALTKKARLTLLDSANTGRSRAVWL